MTRLFIEPLGLPLVCVAVGMRHYCPQLLSDPVESEALHWLPVQLG